MFITLYSSFSYCMCQTQICVECIINRYTLTTMEYGLLSPHGIANFTIVIILITYTIHRSTQICLDDIAKLQHKHASNLNGVLFSN